MRRSSTFSASYPPSIAPTKIGASTYAKSASAAPTFCGDTATGQDRSFAGMVDPFDRRYLGPLLKSSTWSPSQAHDALSQLRPCRAFSESDYSPSTQLREIASGQRTTHEGKSTQDTLTGSPLQVSPLSSEFSADTSIPPQSVLSPSQPSRAPTHPTSEDHTGPPTKEGYVQFYPFDMLQNKQRRSPARSRKNFAAAPRPPRKSTRVDPTIGIDSAASTRLETGGSRKPLPRPTTGVPNHSYMSFPPLLIDPWRSVPLETLVSDGISVQ